MASSVSWSNPDPQAATSASLGNAARIEDINIGPIVHSIMQFRQQQAAAQQQAQQNMYAGIAKAAQSYQQNQQQGAANDAANATMYGIQNPNDPYGGFSDPNRVPDYGGTDAMRMLESAKGLGDFKYESPEDKALQAEKLNLMQSQEYNNYIKHDATGRAPSEMTPRQQVTTASENAGTSQDAFDQYGIPQSVINNPNAIHGPSNTPSVYGTNPDPNDPKKIVPGPSITVPEGQLLMVDPKTGEYIYTTPDQLTKARAALQSAQQANQDYRSKLGASAGVAPPQAPPTSGLPQGVPQAAPAPQSTPTAIPNNGAGLPQITSKADYDNLPKGSTFIGPDGKPWIKP